MPGVASILNKAVAGDARIHLFYNTDKSNLGLLLCDGTQEEADPGWQLVADTNHSEVGIIPNQSSLSATFHRDVQLVFAITSRKTQAGVADTKTHDVSIVSPVYKPLTSTDSKSFALASTAVRTRFHVFFLGRSKDKLVIKNYTFPSGNSDLTRSTPAENTDLSAYTVGTKSHVFYQEEDGTLNEYDVQSNISTKIDAATGVRKGSPLAATYDEKTGKSYLYYVTSPNNVLYRVTKAKDGTKWESPKYVENAAAVNNKAQLTATLANDTNHLFYIEDKPEWSDGDKPVHVYDIKA